MIVVNKEKIFNLGLSRTGNHSLSKALEKLGYKVKFFPKFTDDPQQIKTIMYKFDAALDTPVSCRYKILDGMYPDAKFILTIRDIDSWILSCRDVFERRPHPPDYIKDIRIRNYGAVQFDEQKWRNAYHKHVKEVKEYFKDRKDKLLILNICGGEGWKKLCEFLGKDIPLENFPNVEFGMGRDKEKYEKMKHEKKIMKAYLLLESDKDRVKLVEKNIKSHHLFEIFKAVDYHNWNLVLKFLKKFKIGAYIHKRNRKGKYAKWVSMILIWKYMIEFGIEELVLAEDDVNLPNNVNKFLRNKSKGINNYDYLQLSKFTRFGVWSNKGARRAIYETFEKGIIHANDVWINKFLKNVKVKSNINSISTKKEDGNIFFTPEVNLVDFDYIPNKECTEFLEYKFFKNMDDMDLNKVLERL